MVLKNGEMVTTVWAESVPSWGTSSNVAVLQLVKGDRVWVSLLSRAPYLHGYMYTTFFRHHRLRRLNDVTRLRLFQKNSLFDVRIDNVLTGCPRRMVGNEVNGPMHCTIMESVIPLLNDGIRYDSPIGSNVVMRNRVLTLDCDRKDYITIGTSNSAAQILHSEYSRKSSMMYKDMRLTFGMV
jgi:hypothetical protein